MVHFSWSRPVADTRISCLLDAFCIIVVVSVIILIIENVGFRGMVFFPEMISLKLWHTCIDDFLPPSLTYCSKWHYIQRLNKHLAFGLGHQLLLWNNAVVCPFNVVSQDGIFPKRRAFADMTMNNVGIHLMPNNVTVSAKCGSYIYHTSSLVFLYRPHNRKLIWCFDKSQSPLCEYWIMWHC